MTPTTADDLRFIEAHLAAALKDARESGDAMDAHTAECAHMRCVLVLRALGIKPWPDRERYLRLIEAAPGGNAPNRAITQSRSEEGEDQSRPTPHALDAVSCYNLRECRDGRAIEAELRCKTCPAATEDVKRTPEGFIVKKPHHGVISKDNPLTPGCYCQPGKCGAPKPEWCRDAVKRDWRSATTPASKVRASCGDGCPGCAYCQRPSDATSDAAPNQLCSHGRSMRDNCDECNASPAQNP